MSLVERALQKVQAGEAARRQASKAHADLHVGKVVTGAALPIIEQEPKYNANRLVKVDRDALRAAGLLPPRDQEREIADQYRAIKRPLLEAAFSTEPTEGPPQKLIMIASALPGDGKTFTGVNLALSMAMEKDRTVLLVDGDLAKPHISRLFGVENEPGLLDVLKDPDQGRRVGDPADRHPGPERAACRRALGDGDRAARQRAHGADRASACRA